MKYTLIILLALVSGARAAAPAKTSPEGAPGHESAEDKARTTPDGASLGIKACHDDIDKFCAAVKPGKNRLGKCLKAHSAELSERCSYWLAHGGKGHVDRAYMELDPSKAPAKKAPAPPPAKP